MNENVYKYLFFHLPCKLCSLVFTPFLTRSIEITLIERICMHSAYNIIARNVYVIVF